MRVVSIILARQGSKRLPNKVMKDIAGEPMIRRVVDRLRESNRIDKVVVATNPNSSGLIKYCEDNNIDCFVGSEDDVLDRLYQCAKTFNADIIVRIWHDSPLIDYRLIDAVLGQFTGSYAIIKGYPKGYDFTVMLFRTLEAVLSKMTITDRAIWNECSENLIWETLGFEMKIYKNIEDLSHINLSVDTQADLDKVREIYARSQGNN